MVVEYWLLLMINCLQSVGLIWKTQIWKYCGSTLLLSNLEDPSCWLEFRPPSSTRADDITLENNIEKADLFNKHTVSVGDFNIDASPIPRRTRA